jgi:hypothetical protein
MTLKQTPGSGYPVCSVCGQKTKKTHKEANCIAYLKKIRDHLEIENETLKKQLFSRRTEIANKMKAMDKEFERSMAKYKRAKAIAADLAKCFDLDEEWDV